MIGSWDLQVALLGLLKDTGVFGGRFYEAVPPDVAFPYGVFVDPQALALDVTGRNGTDETVTVDLWERANKAGGHRGRKNLAMAADLIHTELNARSIEVAGRSAAFITRIDFRTVGDPDALTTHGILTFQVQHFGPQEMPPEPIPSIPVYIPTLDFSESLNSGLLVLLEDI